jgi:4-amino-4-deoxy-L-arabinose transferase-like glycosyltransferase
MLGTSLALISWGRNARADMQMCFWMTFAMWAFYRGLCRTGPMRHFLLMLAWFALGLANLAKPLVPLFLGFPLVLYLAWRQADERAPEESRPRTWLIQYLIASLVGFTVFILIRIIPSLQWWTRAGLSDALGTILTLVITLGPPFTVQ